MNCLCREEDTGQDDIPAREYSDSSVDESSLAERPDSNQIQQPVDNLHAAGSSTKFYIFISTIITIVI
jgi:hypothetical protein